MARTHSKFDLIILALLGVLTVLGLVWIGGDRRRPGRDIWSPPSTEVASDSGLLGWYRLLEKLEFPLARNYFPLLPDSLAQYDVIIVAAMPIPTSSPKGESRAIEQWLDRGGTLVTTPEVMDQLKLSDLAPAEVLTWQDGQRAQRIPADQRDAPLARNVDRVRTKGTSLQIDGEDLCLLATSQGVQIAQRSLGQGRLILIADMGMFSNAMIDQADNALVGANLAAYLRDTSEARELAFHEYPFQPGKGGMIATLSFLADTPLGWGIFLCTFAALLWLWNRGRRFGYRHRPRTDKTHTKAALARSVGATYSKAGAYRLGLELLYQWLRNRLCRMVNLPPVVDDTRLARSLERVTAVRAEQVTDALVRCRNVLAKSKVSRKEFRRALDSLQKLESELEDGYPTGP